MEAADIAREIIAQSKGGVHVAFAFSTSNAARTLLEVRHYELLFTSTGECGKNFYHVCFTKGDKLIELKYSSVDSAAASVHCKCEETRRSAVSRPRPKLVLYRKGSPTLMELTPIYFPSDKSTLGEEIKKKLRLLDVVGLVDGE